MSNNNIIIQVERAIENTPTGEFRNLLTDINILLHHADTTTNRTSKEVIKLISKLVNEEYKD